MDMKRRPLAALALSALTVAAMRPAAAAAPFGTEIIVRTIRNIHRPEDVVSLVELAARNHVSVINLAAKQDEDDECPSGAVFYASTIVPRAPGYKSFDVLQLVIEEAHRRGIKVRAWVPQFHDQIAGLKNSDWQMQVQSTTVRSKPYFGGDKGEFFVNPLSAGVQSYERSIIAEIVRNYDVDGIVVDWLRFDDYNMDVGNETRAMFEKAVGYDPIVIDFKTDNPRRVEWNAWRTARIADYVGSLRQAIDAIKPGLELGIYILPPEFVEVGQDAAQFARHVSFIAPMIYFEDWGYPLSWVNTNVMPQTKAKAKGTPIIPTMDSDWSDAAYEEILVHTRRAFPEVSTLAWFVYGVWTEALLARIDKTRRY